MIDILRILCYTPLVIQVNLQEEEIKMAVNPIKKQSVSELVFEQLKEQIIRGEWPVGTKIPSENELCSMMGVSRVSVRHALQKLTVLGLIETRQADGSYVCGENVGSAFKVAITPAALLQPHNLDEVLEFRRAIEIQTAGLAAKNAEDAQLAELSAIYERQLQAAESASLKEYASLDMDFHMAIARCAHNSLIETVYEVLWDLLSIAMEETVSKLGFGYAKKYHKLLIDAIRKGNAEEAESVMREHLAENEKAVRK